jgi:branched-chain amino acid transport system ATP-binding protein
VSGLVPAGAGRLEVDGRRVDGLPAHARVAFGLAHVLERRRLFPHLTVRQNLLLGAYHPAAKPHRAESLAWVEALFPRLRERQDQPARTLSGGEQQMVAIARGLMARPRLLLVDEPTLGLAPRVVADILDVLRRINREQGVTVLFIEQNVELALSIAHRGYVLESGRLLLDGTAEALRASDEVRRIFLGR